MRIKDFQDHKEHFKYFPEFQCPLYFGGGEFIGEISFEEIIYYNLNREEFRDKILEKVDIKITSETDIRELNLRIADEDFSDGILDGNHEGFNCIRFYIKDILFTAYWEEGASDINGKLLASAGYVEIYEAKSQINLTLS